MLACCLQQRAVLHAARTRHFTRAAAQTKIDMPNRIVTECRASVLERTHEIDASARRIVFVPGFQVSRARGKTEAAMHAGEGFLLVEEWFRRNDAHNESSEKIFSGS